jgi:endonuclease/exonuclease/phosphatase family metal-dependent hydrolase
VRASDDLRAMSYNMRMGVADDGVNDWDRRKDFLVETIKAFAPDLLGTQETLDFQRDFLAAKLVGYDYVGVGRDDGREEGEMMLLFYRRERFDKLDGGHFWLGETPAVAGSKGWDAACARMVTWVKLRDRRQPDARPIVFFNTHLDHLGVTARLESAQLIRRRLAELGAGSSLVLTGDFNSGEGGAPYLAVFGPLVDQPSPIVDTYRVAHPGRGPNEASFSAFTAGARPGERIDWIGVSRDWHVAEATIDFAARDGRTPSDHFPVEAVLRRSISQR